VELWKENKHSQKEGNLRLLQHEIVEKDKIRRQLAEAEKIERDACRVKIAEWRRMKEAKQMEEMIEKEAKTAMKLAKAHRKNRRQLKIKSVVDEYKRMKTIKKLEEQREYVRRKGDKRQTKARVKERQRLRHRNLKILSKRFGRFPKFSKQIVSEKNE